MKLKGTSKHLLEDKKYALGNNIPEAKWFAFVAHKNNAKRRNISFEFTLEQWVKWWETDNKWENRGRRKKEFVMARYNDEGPYAPDNVYCATSEKNVADFNNNKVKKETACIKNVETKNNKIKSGVDVCKHLRRENHPKSRKITTPDGVFLNATVASEHYGITRQAASLRAKRNSKGWAFL